MNTKDQPITQAELDEGDTAAERFKGFVKKIIAVPKEEVDEKQREWEKQQTKKKMAKKN